MAYAALVVCGWRGTAQRFEVAAIKPSIADSNSNSGIKTATGRLDAYNVTLKRCIMGAYGVGPHQITGGPDWLESDRFQITAKAEQPIDDDALLMAMLRSLLAERFKLNLHRETKSLQAYTLEVAKNGPKIERAAAGESSTNTSTDNSGIVMEARCTDMEGFARILARSVDLPVVNGTGLRGLFNFTLRWTPQSARTPSSEAPDGPSLFTAVQEQLGLRLRAGKAPVEVIVIDHVEKPSAN